VSTEFYYALEIWTNFLHFSQYRFFHLSFINNIIAKMSSYYVFSVIHNKTILIFQAVIEVERRVQRVL